MAIGGGRTSGDTAVLDRLRAEDEIIAAAEVRRLVLTVEWAVANECDPAEASPDGWFGDTALALAGAGAPLVSEFAAMEYAAARGLSTDAGYGRIAEALELRYRLPRLWERVVDGRVPVWRARQVADQTLALSVDAAGFVDRHLAPVAHSCSWAQVDRLVDEAVARFDPALAEERRRAAADARWFDVRLAEASVEGVVPVDGVLDLADAHDLEAAVRAGARQLRDLGASEPLDVLRSQAVGEMARHQLAFAFESDGPAKPSAGRSVVLHVHTTPAALGGVGSVARFESPGGTAAPVLMETVREWCGRPDATVTVKPVIDVADHVHVAAYEVPDRVAAQVAERDLTCVFPHCAKPARRCDTDHVIPHNSGGATCAGNLAPLCRWHHRAKTHGAWSYRALRPGAYLWTTPSGYQVLRDHRGTHPVAPPSHDP